MSNDTPTGYYFLPWARYGALAGTKGLPSYGKKELQPAPSIPGRATVGITLRLIGTHPDGKETIEDVSIGQTDKPAPLHFYGPGDVIGIDAREIVRTEPRNMTLDFPPYFFPFIEFDRPDFPWLFTPASPDDDDCLRPWIVLVVMPKAVAKFNSSVTPQKPLPTLTCKVKELPDLRESSAWAHAQYVGAAGSELDDDKIAQALSTQPYQNVSRLLCPRKLEPHHDGANGSYYACVVPAFEVGRQAGLGRSIQGNELLEPAWDISKAETEIELPIYYHWEFATGAEENFKELAMRLEHYQEPTTSSNQSNGTKRRMDMSQPCGKQKFIGATMGIPSALQLVDPSPPDWNSDSSVSFDSFQQWLKSMWKADGSSVETTVPPPIYGSWYLGSSGNVPGHPEASEVLFNKSDWLENLNLDPRYRVVAGLGTQIIQQQQEQLVTAAWEQAAELKTVNQWLAQKQLGRAVTTTIHKNRLGNPYLSDQGFKQLISPIPSEIIMTPVAHSMSIQDLGESPPVSSPRPLQDATISAAYRRMARPLGAVTRQRMKSEIVSSAIQPIAVMPMIVADFARPPSSGCDFLFDIAPPLGATASAVTVSGYPCQQIKNLDETVSNETSQRKWIHTCLHPFTTFEEETSRLEFPETFDPNTRSMDALGQFNFSPSFTQPMYEPLRERFQEMLFPGLDRIPNNTVAVLKPNPKFIEAYMVGLNHEFSRELLWREFPTYLNATYFKQFWDLRGSEDKSPDFNDILNWNAPLGKNLRSERGENLVMLLIRGDLLLHYPNLVIYAQQGTSQNLDHPEINKYSILRVEPVPGVTLLGFDLPNVADWFFVIEEHPTETRFGLDHKRESPFTFWHDLSWQAEDGVEVKNGHLSLAELPHRPKGDVDISKAITEQDKEVIWAKNASHMAFITLRKAYRLLIPASQWRKI